MQPNDWFFADHRFETSGSSRKQQEEIYIFQNERSTSIQMLKALKLQRSHA